MSETIKVLFEASVGQAYDIAARRFSAAEARMQHTLTLAPAILVAIVIATAALADGRPLDFNGFAIAAVVPLGLILLLWASVWLWPGGGLHMLNPAKFDDNWKGLSPDDCRKHLMTFSGRHLAKNVRRIDLVSKVANAMALALVVSIAFGAMWTWSVLGQGSS